MRKELFYAIAAGALLGLVIAFGIWRVNSSISKNQPISTSTSSPTPQTGFAITIAKLENNDIMTESPVTISGLTKANTWVGISAEEKDYVVKSDVSGSFEVNIALVGGLNNLLFFAADEEGNSTQQKLALVYSSEFPETKEETIPSPKEEATQEAETVREKVQKKVAKVLKQPKAYLGTVTDIADSTLQIKSQAGEIQQVSVKDQTAFVKTDKTNKTIKYTDIAIGDFIIAMGYKNGNSVLNAERVLVTTSPSATTRKIIAGQFESINKREISLKQASETTTVTIPNNAVLVSKKDGKTLSLKLTDLEVGNNLFVFGQEDSKSLTVRTLVNLIDIATPSPTATTSPSTSPSSTPSLTN